MFKISTRENKVYDITDRKNYCSNNCYKAGTFLKDQLYTSPLWLRDCEAPVEYEVLSSSKSGNDSGAGAEIDLGNTKPVKIDKPHIDEAARNTVKSDISQNKVDTLKHKLPYASDKDKNISEPSITSKEIKRREMIQPLDDEKLDSSNKKENEPINIPNSLSMPIIDSDNEVSHEKGKKLQSKEVKRPKRVNKDIKPINIISEIEQRVESWFTFETMLYLLGQEKVRELLKMSGYNEDVKPKKDDHSFYLKCQEIYKKLNILELKDQEKQRPSKPVPDYDALRKESEKLEIKVRSFYKGDAKTMLTEDEMTSKDSDPENEEDPILPPIDHCSVLLSRRRIFIERLNKVLPDMLNALELSHFRLGIEMQELVSTFNLGPSNICMRPPEWTLVAVILIKLLTLRNDVLEFAYSREIAQKRLNTYLLTYDLDGGYPERFTTYLMDIERITSMMDIK